MRIRLACVLLALITNSVFADEAVRQVQEALRKRNLYFGNVDGHMTADVSNALKRYQERKGFAVTGQIDETTAGSLNVVTPGEAASKQSWPDVPVLKSDTALAIAETERERLVRQAEENVDAVPTPAPPAEQPPASQSLTPARIEALVQQYLRDGESRDVAAQIAYFEYPVNYFGHGLQDPKFVKKDVADYCKRWPERKYELIEPVTFAAAENENEAVVEFPISFSVRNKKHAAKGKTRNTWTVRAEGDELKIVAIREERLRD